MDLCPAWGHYGGMSDTERAPRKTRPNSHRFTVGDRTFGRRDLALGLLVAETLGYDLPRSVTRTRVGATKARSLCVAVETEVFLRESCSVAELAARSNMTDRDSRVYVAGLVDLIRAVERLDSRLAVLVVDAFGRALEVLVRNHGKRPAGQTYEHIPREAHAEHAVAHILHDATRPQILDASDGLPEWAHALCRVVFMSADRGHDVTRPKPLE